MKPVARSAHPSVQQRTTSDDLRDVQQSITVHHADESARDGSLFVKSDGKPSEHRPNDAALTAHLMSRPGFDASGVVERVDVVREQALDSQERGVRYAVLTVDVTSKTGKIDRYTLPVTVDAKGKVADGLKNDGFKHAMIAAVEAGTSFEPGAAKTTARKSSGAERTRKPSSWLATRAAPKVKKAPRIDAQALIAKGYTTPDRLAFVREQAKKLSPENADALVATFFKGVKETIDAQPPEIRAFHEALATKPKFGPVFYGYAQFMGVPDGKGAATFDDLVPLLDVISKGDALSSMTRDGKQSGLGFQEIELLPFYLSPQKDGGYDITDHAQVDPSLGGNEAFSRFMAECVARGVRVTADLVANHVSYEHEWVKALLDGDAPTIAKMLERFVVWDDAVKVGERVVGDKTFNVFLHTKGENAGKVSHVWQIFPDNNPDTFIAAKAGGETHQVFASFMNPYQWDVNVQDPAVLAYYLETISTFANMGQMGTRMDAIIHSGKKPGTFNINNDEAQAFMALAKSFAAHVAPGSTFLPEANLPWSEAKRDWLAPERTFDGKVENVAGDILISFDVHRAIWDSLLKEDKRAWVDTQNALGELPANKSLLVYLGLHDETLIEDPELRKQLLARGHHDFAGRGVGDSPAQILASPSGQANADRLAMAHALLYSSKGHPAVYYRTVVGPMNNDAYFEDKKRDRLADQRSAGEQENVAKATDTRDLDRGPVARAEYEKALADGYKPAITIRALNALWASNGSVRTNRVVEVKNPDAGVVSLARTSTETSDAPLLQLVNLTGEKKRVTFALDDLAKELGWTKLDGGKLVDLLASEIAGRERTVPFAVDGKNVVIELAPYEATYLQRDA